jgi:hypothetical protein
MTQALIKSSTQDTKSAVQRKLLPVLTTKSQLNKIVLNKDGSPDRLAINMFWDDVRSWYAPLKKYNSDGSVICSKKLKTQGVYYKTEYLSETHSASQDTIRRKLVKLEQVGLILRGFAHKEYATTKSYNRRVIYALKDTPHFHNPHGIDINDIRNITPQTNADYIEKKHGIVAASKTQQDAATKAKKATLTHAGTKELIEPFNKLKDRSNESNSFDFNNSNSSIETKTNDFVETKNIVAGEGGNTEATIHTLKPKKHTNSRKKSTNADTKAKKAKTYRFNQFETPKPLNYFHPLKAEEGSELRIKSGRDIPLNAQNEILLDMATNRPNLQGHRFKSKAQFMAYMSKALYHEKRDSVKISGIHFYIKANQTEERKIQSAKAAKIETFLSQVEQSAIVGRNDETQFKAKLVGTLKAELAYDILSNLSRFDKEDDVFKLIMSKEVEITDFDKQIILNQANAVGAYNGVERLEFVVVGNVAKEYHNSNNPEPEKLPDGVWGEVSKKLVALYGVDIYKSWFSKLTAIVDETSKTIELKATSEFIKDWIVSNYGDMISKIVAGMNFELKRFS